MPKTSLLSPDDLTKKISRELQVTLGTFQPDVTEIRCQQWQLRFQLRVLFVPQK